MYDSKNNMLSDKAKGISPRHRKAFTLIELVATLVIIGIIISSTMVVMERCIGATIDYNARAIAFRLARDNMENLLNNTALEETAEFGIYEFNQDIQWETVVETFTEPINSALWLQAICSASYTDKDGERQSVELTNWITELTATQQRQIRDQEKREQEFMDEFGENPFGDDADGMLEYADLLAGSGDYEAAMQAAYDLMTEYPDSQQAKVAQDKARQWMRESTGFAIPGFDRPTDGSDIYKGDGSFGDNPYQDPSRPDNNSSQPDRSSDGEPKQKNAPDNNNQPQEKRAPITECPDFVPEELRELYLYLMNLPY